MGILPEGPDYRLFLGIQVIYLYALVVKNLISAAKGNHQGSNPVCLEKAGQVPGLSGGPPYPGRIDAGYQTDFHLLEALSYINFAVLSSPVSISFPLLLKSF